MVKYCKGALPWIEWTGRNMVEWLAGWQQAGKAGKRGASPLGDSGSRGHRALGETKCGVRREA